MVSRVLIASTPRSGNTWLRRQVGELLGLTELAAHTPAEVQWDALPSRCVLQLHWFPTPELLTRLHHNNFRFVVLARHPLDVLLSILHFAPHEPQTARWLAGEGGDESLIVGQTPVSAATLRYGCSARFNALLAVSARWWRRPEAIRVRYEELVESTGSTLEKLCSDLGHPGVNASFVVAQNALERLRRDSTNQHFWQGRPGLWRSLIDADMAEAVYQANRDFFETLGYTIDDKRRIERSVALATWRAIE